MRAMKIWADTIRQQPCFAAACRRIVYAAEHARTGRMHVFESRPVPVVQERELSTDRPLWMIDLDVTPQHYATCAARQLRRSRMRAWR